YILTPNFANAQTASEIQAKIDQRNTDIQGLEKEIAGYQSQIDKLGSQASSLSVTIKSLDLTQKKLAADIKITENKILAKNLQIQELSSQISNKEDTISDDHGIIARSFALMNEYGDRSIPEILLSGDSVSNALDSFDNLATVQNVLVDHVNDIKQVKADLEANKHATEQAKADLQRLNKQINDQRQVVVNTQAEQNKLLKETKQTESGYQKILATKKAQKEAFEKEVLSFESQLHLSVDLSKTPHTGSGVLSWPLDKVKITQYFGNTPFATANPQIYNGFGHTGVDFGAAIGTPIKAALNGTVVGVGNTDILSTCLSFGKWIMVEHPNGLSTLYGHMSLQTVSKGQEVATGQVIGYSGNTGYSTGPHLHFGVYATQGVEITTFPNSKNCRGILIPLADFKAYLNPLSYL
ncbi:MAG: peptidoglycan DD-metalloendopeptidase family protein, partial [Candidatus Taylorbacteria bacterium]|nr:peptidoglycan DD-metalloendopeptidase family protein [Candidatus Taylorbacteria bacterium]